MLKDDFFSIISIEKEDNSYKIMLKLHTEHKIFEGHFPGQPLVPGACMLQMVKEVTATIMDKNIRLTKADNLKFLKPIDPHKLSVLLMNLSYTISTDGIIHVSANLSSGPSIYFKCIGSFIG